MVGVAARVERPIRIHPGEFAQSLPPPLQSNVFPEADTARIIELGLVPGNIQQRQLSTGTHGANRVWEIFLINPPDGVPKHLLLKQCVVNTDPARDIRSKSVHEEVDNLRFFEQTRTPIQPYFALPMLYAGESRLGNRGIVKTMIVPWAEGQDVRTVLTAIDGTAHQPKQPEEEFVQMTNALTGLWNDAVAHYAASERLGGGVDLSLEMTRREWANSGTRLMDGLKLLKRGFDGTNESGWLRNRLLVNGEELASFGMALQLVHHYFLNEHPYAIPFHPDPTLANTVWNGEALHWIDAGFDRNMPVEAALARMLKVESSSTLTSLETDRVEFQKGARRGNGVIQVDGYRPVFGERIVQMQQLADQQLDRMVEALDDPDLRRRKMLADIWNLTREVVLAPERGGSQTKAAQMALRGLVEACRLTTEYIRVYQPEIQLDIPVNGIFDIFRNGKYEQSRQRFLAA